MKKIVLLGDSIRLIGYGKPVAEAFKDKYEVFQYDDNGRFAQYTLRSLFDYKDNIMGADVVHWNNGAWDVCDLFGDGPFTPVDFYVDTMVRIARILKTYSKKVIFANTIPTSPNMWGHSIERTRAYNKAVTEALEKEGVIINDLFSIVEADIEGCICEDFIHLSPKGIELCSAQVIKVIEEAME